MLPTASRCLTADSTTLDPALPMDAYGASNAKDAADEPRNRHDGAVPAVCDAHRYDTAPASHKPAHYGDVWSLYQLTKRSTPLTCCHGGFEAVRRIAWHIFAGAEPRLDVRLVVGHARRAMRRRDSQCLQFRLERIGRLRGSPIGMQDRRLFSALLTPAGTLD